MVGEDDDKTVEWATRALDPSSADAEPKAAACHPHGLAIGAMVDHFRIERSLGEGGMGEVFLARDTTLDRPVALKVIRREMPSETIKQQFLFEARATAKFGHPHIVTIHAVGEHAGRPYLVLEYLEGITLHRRIQQGGLDIAEILRTGLAIAEALAEAHGRGILHLDLKPANVFVPNDRPLRVLDFGLARTLGTRPRGAAAAAEDAALALTGTPPYMAPEQWREQDPDGAVDVWALGVIVYELCARARPFPAATLPELAMAVCSVEPAPEIPGRPELPEGLRRLIRACLDKLPERRPTAARAVEVLGTLLAEHDDAAVSRRRPTHVPTLAVLPLEVRGAGAEDFGEAITDELIDVLSRMRGWRVLAAAATARYRDKWEPRAVADELGVQAIVHGTVQMSAARVRVTARLLDARSGSQLWSERFSGDIVDLFELQDRLARRIAEALRSELTATIHRGDASAEAVAQYLLARQKLRQDALFGPAGAVELLDACLERAPSFKPALSAHAMAAMRAWFFPARPDQRDWQAFTRKSVARALQHAGELPETHLASARLQVVDGAFAAAARDIARTLDIAPTCAEAHAFLAMLQCEAGRSGEGVRRARLAIELDPTLFGCLIDIMRDHAFSGDWSRYEAVLAELVARAPVDHPGVEAMEMRIAAWRGDRAAIRRRLDQGADARSPSHLVVRLPARVLLGELAIDEALAMHRAHTGGNAHPRMRTLGEQIYAETAFLIGAFELGAELFLAVTAGPLVDIDWVDRCSALAPMRSHPSYAEARHKVVERAAAIWTAGCPPLELAG